MKHLIKTVLVITLTLLAGYTIWLSPIHAKTKALNLNYWPILGDYSLNIYIADQLHAPYGVSLDTGSANLNLIGNTSFCPTCEPIIQRYKKYQPTEDVKALDETFTMKYGIGGGLLKAFQSRITLGPDLSVPAFQFAVYKSGDNLSNLLGLAYNTIAEPKANPTILDKLNEQYDFNHEFSMLLCDNRGPSKLYLGPPPKSIQQLPHYTVPIIKKTFYTVEHFGISSEAGTLLTPLRQTDEAILDSGTTGKLVYPRNQLKPLIEYLKRYTANKNEILPDVFWQGTTCIPADMINHRNFPTLYFHFKDTEDKTIRLPLPSERYITSSGCGTGYKKIAFIGFKEHKNHPKTKHHKRNMPKTVLLGTPFLEHYVTRFQQKNPAQITFYESASLCQGK